MWNHLLIVVTAGVLLLAGYGLTTSYYQSGEAQSADSWKLWTDDLTVYWIPTASERRLKPADCQRAQLARLMRDPKVDTLTLGRNVQAWLDRCDHAFPSPLYNSYQVLLDFLLMNYDFKKNPQVQIADYHLKGGQLVRGILATHDDETPRPFVIVRCGVVCNLDNGPDKASILMHLFEESGFHVLILISSTSSVYAKDNNEMFVSGLEEGAQMIEILDQIYRSEFMKKVSEFHIMGFSLGGHAALFASRLALRRKDLPIRSAFAMCPVVDLKAQMLSVLSEDYKGYFFDSQIRNIFHSSEENVQQVAEIASQLDKVPRSEIPGKVMRGSFDTLRARRTAASDLGFQFPKTYSDFLTEMKFQNQAELPGLPTLVVYSEDDVVVDSPINSGVLPKNKKGLGIVGLKRGNHCAFNQGIEWSSYSEILRGFFSRHSKSKIVKSFSGLKFDLSELEVEGGALPEQRLLGATWIVTPKPYRLGLQLSFPSRKKAHLAGSYCKGVQDYDLPQFCQDRRVLIVEPEFYRQMGGELNLQQTYRQMDFVTLGKISRWLNTRTVLLNRDGELAIGQTSRSFDLQLEAQIPY